MTSVPVSFLFFSFFFFSPPNIHSLWSCVLCVRAHTAVSMNVSLFSFAFVIWINISLFCFILIELPLMATNQIIIINTMQIRQIDTIARACLMPPPSPPLPLLLHENHYIVIYTIWSRSLYLISSLDSTVLDQFRKNAHFDSDTITMAGDDDNSH